MSRSFHRLLAALLLVAAAPVLKAQSSVRGPLSPEHQPARKFQSFPEERWDASSFAPPGAIDWWRKARLGLFIHFGVASLKGVELGWGRGTRAEPDRGTGPIPDEIYDRLYQELRMENFDARAWVATARSAGAGYIVVVTKHHDGFHLWDTALSNYKITRSPFGRDYIKEIVDACHEARMPVGFYFAQREWYHPHYDPRDRFPEKDHRKYIEYQFAAVRELLTKYGKIDILWFDAAWWGGMFREQDWDSERLYRMARELQPAILINNRASIPGDFDTPEQHVGQFQHGRPWESCITLTKRWGYVPDSPVKSLAEVVALLVQTATGDGNLLLNTGPMPDGRIQPKEQAVLSALGDWLRLHGESIRDTRGGPFRNGTWGGATYRGDTVYVHVLRWPGETLRLPALEEKILSARALTGGVVRLAQDQNGVSLSMSPEDRDPIDTIIALKLDRPVSTIHARPAATTLFDGPGYGDPITGSATLRTSSPGLAGDRPVSPSALFRGENDGAVFLTRPERAPWAEIDLGSVKNVKGVRIVNSPGETGTRGIELLLSADGRTWEEIWRADALAPEWSVAVTQFVAGAHIAGRPARYLRLRLPDDEARPLRLKQLQVYGDELPR